MLSINYKVKIQFLIQLIQINIKYYCYEFKLIYVLIVLRGNWVKTDLPVKQCSPIRWEIFYYYLL